MMERLRAWWPIAAVAVAVVGFVTLFVQQSTAIATTRELETSVVAMHGRLVALEQTTSQLRLDSIGSQMRGAAPRVPRPRPMPDADGQPGGTKAKGKAKAGGTKAKAGKAKTQGAEGAAKAGKGKSKRGKAKANSKIAP
jgi:hypothetical protein